VYKKCSRSREQPRAWIEYNAALRSSGPSVGVRGPDYAELEIASDGAVIGARQADGRTRVGRIDELTIGRTVRGWGTGQFDSCPGQSGAVEAEILDDHP
jgi:hypothetical protein